MDDDSRRVARLPKVGETGATKRPVGMDDGMVMREACGGGQRPMWTMASNNEGRYGGRDILTSQPHPLFSQHKAPPLL